MANVSLLLPSFKRAHLLRLGLHSLVKNPTIHNLEIVVLNDGIEDDTEAVCRQFPQLNIRYIFTGQRNKDCIKKRVPGFALNIGFKKCSHDIIVLSCPEMFHLNNGIDLIVSTLINNPNTMVIPEFIYFDKSQVTTNSLLSNINNPIDTSTLVGGAYGACHVEMPFLMAFYKKHAIDIGGYDEDFIGYAGEDCDFIERFKLKGLTHLRTKAQAIHLWHEGSTDGACHFENPDWVINWNLLQGRKGILNRNVGREWGVLEEQKPTLSIIIPTFKRTDLLPFGLSSIRKQQTVYNYEILVINDGVEDETEEICKKFNATYIFTGERNKDGLKWRCPGTAINFGVSRAKGDIILIMCPEIHMVQGNLLQRLINEVIVSRNVIAITQGFDDLTGKFLEHLKVGGTWDNYNPISPETHIKALHTEYPFCLCMEKKRFLDVGGYDEAFTDGIGYDDTDFYFRVVKNGIIYMKANDLTIIHLYHDRYTRAGIDPKVYQQLLEKNKQLYMTKNNATKYL